MRDGEDGGALVDDGLGAAHEQWSVQIIESSDFRRPGGRVQLELADGSETEASRGLAVLRQVAELLRHP